MSVLFLMLFCFFFGCGCVISEIHDIRKKFRIDLSNVFCFTYGATFGLLPSIYLFMYEFLDERIIRISYDKTDLNYLWIWFILAVFGYGIFKLIYRSSFTSKDTRPFDLNANDSEISKRDYARLQFTGVVCLAIGVVSLYLWSNAYGGIFEFVKVANAVRSGFYDVVNPLAFFKHPAKVTTFVSYIFLFLVKRRYHTVINFLLLCVSLFYSICFLLAGDGRMTTVMYFVIIFLIATDMFANRINVSKRIFLILVCFVCMGIFILNLDGITAAIRGNVISNDQTESATFLEELSFIVASGQISVEHMIKSGSPNLILHDIAQALFAWVPTSLKPNGIIDIWSYNTFVYRNGGFGVGQVPCDFVSTSIYDFGFFGIIILASLWGAAIKFMDNSRRKNSSPFYQIVYCSFAMAIFRLPEYCLMYDFVIGMFNIFVAAVIWKVSALVIGVPNGKIKTYQKTYLR